MSEKRFRVMNNDSKQLYCIESVDGEMFSIQEVVDLLNEQQATIKRQESLIRKLSEKLEECGLVKINGDVVEWIDDND